MEIDYSIIDPTGNITLIVETALDRAKYKAAADALMARHGDVQQVGFLESAASPHADMRLQMAGGEFCGNASIALSALVMGRWDLPVGEKGVVHLEVSGNDDISCVEVERLGENDFRGSVDMPQPRDVGLVELPLDGGTRPFPVVSFPGISHAIVKPHHDRALLERAIKDWCYVMDTDAMGILVLNEEKMSMEALVYVPGSDTLFWEGSCGSGSAAVGAYLSWKQVDAVSVSISQPGGTLSVTADVIGDPGMLKLRGGASVVGSYKAEVDI